MEIKTRDPNYPMNFNDGLDSELDRIGVVLDTPMICGQCMIQMTKVGEHEFRCMRCGNSMILSNKY